MLFSSYRLLLLPTRPWKSCRKTLLVAGRAVFLSFSFALLILFFFSLMARTPTGVVKLLKRQYGWPVPWENSPHFATPPLDFLTKWRWKKSAEIAYLWRVTSAADWKKILLQPIRSTTQIWVVTRHQYGISALVSQTSFGEETNGGIAKCRLFLEFSGQL